MKPKRQQRKSADIMAVPTLRYVSSHIFFVFPLLLSGDLFCDFSAKFYERFQVIFQGCFTSVRRHGTWA
jgi:hypothetical protein